MGCEYHLRSFNRKLIWELMISTNIYAGQLAQRKVNIYYHFLEVGEFSEEIMSIH